MMAIATEPLVTRDSPRFFSFGLLASVSLVCDALSKAWAVGALEERGPVRSIGVWEPHLRFALAYNHGGAWGLLQNASEAVRRPFFLVVSASAVVFLVSLYSQSLPAQRSLRLGLSLVLGGALGNLADRLARGSVVDFIDYQASWVEGMNHAIAQLFSGWHVTPHWPTFNLADVSICVGVGLMALDMLRKGSSTPAREQ